MDQYFPKVIYRALFLLFSFLLFLLSIYSHGDVPVNKAGLWESVGIGGSVTHASQAPRLSKRYARVIFGQAFFSPKFHLHNPSLNTPQMHMRTHTHTHTLSMCTHIHWTMFNIRLMDTSEKAELHSTVQFKQVMEDLPLFCGSIELLLFLMEAGTKAVKCLVSCTRKVRQDSAKQTSFFPLSFHLILFINKILYRYLLYVLYTITASEIT